MPPMSALLPAADVKGWGRGHIYLTLVIPWHTRDIVGSGELCFVIFMMAISMAIRWKISLTLLTLAYVTYQDIRKISGLKDQTVIVVKAPPETRLEVPDSIESLQIHLASTQGPIEVYLCPEETETHRPMKTNNQDHNGNIPKPTSKDLASNNSGHSDCSVSTANLSPLASPANLLQQTEDQIPSNLEGPFVNLLPPLLQEDYLLSLGEEEGISDLFDAYDLEKLPLVEDFMCS
ncbi:E2F transcription factor 3 [Cricetulus griseus]